MKFQAASCAAIALARDRFGRGRKIKIESKSREALASLGTNMNDQRLDITGLRVSDKFAIFTFIIMLNEHQTRERE